MSQSIANQLRFTYVLASKNIALQGHRKIRSCIYIREVMP